jgi:UDP-2,3-diacylglucosamine pyrophosphatase LpxH
VDFFVFGHYHTPWDVPVGDARLLVLSDWRKPNWLVFNAEDGSMSFVTE